VNKTETVWISNSIQTGIYLSLYNLQQ